jgi:hypothetical protein
MKSSRPTRIGFAFLAAAFACGAVLAQDIPLRNWEVPPYHRSSASGGLSTMADISPGIAFVAMQPCRIVDTRGGTVFVGAYGPPIMAANAIRPFDLNSAPHCTGIPAGVEAYSLNFTVTQTAGASGDIRAWPTGNPPTVVTSVLNWTQVNAVVANGIIIPAGTNGSIDVQVAGSNTHLLIDINGYFTDEFNDGGGILAIGNQGSFFLPGSLVTGINNNNGTFAYGTFGVSVSEGADSAGVGGWATGAVGRSYGVYGQVSSSASGAGGVYGQNHAGFATDNLFLGAGVFGNAGSGAGGVESGVAGYGFERGVTGYQCTDAGACGTGGVVGYNVAGTGLHSFNNITKGGSVNFVAPHPSDASKEIVYASLEGSEVGTYFRGRGKFDRGLARIAVPEDFRLVTEPDGLSIQVTPIGEMATVAVAKIDLNEIVVRGSRNVEFFYTVNGVRKDYADFKPIRENVNFVPRDAQDTLPDWKQESFRRILVSNGTLRDDGSINLETAQRLGWDKIWAERERIERLSRANAAWEAERQRLSGSSP